MTAGNMLPLFKVGVPLGEWSGRVVTIVHQAAYLGSTYLLLSLATVALRYLCDVGALPKPDFGLGG